MSGPLVLGVVCPRFVGDRKQRLVSVPRPGYDGVPCSCGGSETGIGAPTPALAMVCPPFFGGSEIGISVPILGLGLCTPRLEGYRKRVRAHLAQEM